MLLSKKLTLYIGISIIVITHMSLAHSIDPDIQKNNSTYEVDNKFSISLYDSLFSAIEIDNSFEVKMFIEFGADINHRYANGKTPLMIASSIGSINTVKLLLELGADPKLKSNSDLTAMDYAHKLDEILIINALKTSNTSNQNQSATTVKHANDIIIAEDILIEN